LAPTASKASIRTSAQRISAATPLMLMVNVLMVGVLFAYLYLLCIILVTWPGHSGHITPDYKIADYTAAAGFNLAAGMPLGTNPDRESHGVDVMALTPSAVLLRLGYRHGGFVMTFPRKRVFIYTASRSRIQMDFRGGVDFSGNANMNRSYVMEPSKQHLCVWECAFTLRTPTPRSRVVHLRPLQTGAGRYIRRFGIGAYLQEHAGDIRRVLLMLSPADFATLKKRNLK
jgi:hypothetical protein